MEATAISVATSTGDSNPRDALEVVSGRRSSTSIPTTKHQGRTIGTNIVETARLEEVDVIGDTRITDRLRRTTICEVDTISSIGSLVDAGDRASAACTGEEGDCNPHRRSGGNKESCGDEDDVELHYD